MVLVNPQCAQHQPMDHHKASWDEVMKDLRSACTLGRVQKTVTCDNSNGRCQISPVRFTKTLSFLQPSVKLVLN